MASFEGTSVVHDLPEVAKRYLAHAIAPSVALADTVDLEIEGSIMQKGRWFSFTAHERLEAGIGWGLRNPDLPRNVPVRYHRSLVLAFALIPADKTAARGAGRHPAPEGRARCVRRRWISPGGPEA